MTSFKIEFLDHVALRVADVEVSAKWYKKVLGLSQCQLEKWGNAPILMLAGKTGVALFPAHQEDSKMPSSSKNVKIDHFAFNITNENFEKAKQKYKELGLEYEIQDHHYFHSIYTKDPDGHLVELTTIVVDETDFYQSSVKT